MKLYGLAGHTEIWDKLIIICIIKLLMTSYANYQYVEIFVLKFKAYGPKAVRSMPLERQNRYFPYRTRSRLMRAFLYTCLNKRVYDGTFLCKSNVNCVRALPGP